MNPAFERVQACMVYERSRKICVISGDGIGPEVTAVGCAILDKLNQKYELGLELIEKDWGANKWLEEGVGLPEGALDDLRSNYDAIYFGALGDPRIPDMAHGREILLGMRFGLDLYANVRPVSNRNDINLTIIRENTEDSYTSIGGNFKQGTVDEVAIDESIHTYKGVRRIIEYAFEYAVSKNRSHVTLGDKANAIRYGGSLWQRVFKEMAAKYPNIQTSHRYVDVLAMELVMKPQAFDVIVTSNLFGDILSDLGAGLVGGIGLAASANLHPGSIGLFEPVHGSAPDIAGQGIANPLAAAMTAGMMLEYLGAKQAAKDIQTAASRCLQNGPKSPDLGGHATTREVQAYLLNVL